MPEHEQPETDWPEPPPPEPFVPSPESEAFYAGVMGRITRLIPVLGALGALVCWWHAGIMFAAGFAVGGGVAYLNFYWLKRVVGALGETDGRRAARGAVRRFLLRYAVIALAGYAILKVSRQSLYGMLAGLFLPVAAIGCEAVYEVYAALRRGL